MLTTAWCTCFLPKTRLSESSNKASTRPDLSAFGFPISINPPRDNSENVGYSVTLPASGEGVLIFWGTKWMGSGAHNQDLFYGWLHPDMKRVYVGENTIPGARLVETAEYEMLDYHRSLGNR